mmetsp:Transcript_41538/g.125882  ORF Transcript_41538/g.125882 Transcript_41538/m.125882 type:complete len:274 (+) Transcript_41538:843-1664(+)
MHRPLPRRRRCCRRPYCCDRHTPPPSSHRPTTTTPFRHIEPSPRPPHSSSRQSRPSMIPAARPPPLPSPTAASRQSLPTPGSGRIERRARRHPPRPLLGGHRCRPPPRRPKSLHIRRTTHSGANHVRRNNCSSSSSLSPLPGRRDGRTRTVRIPPTPSSSPPPPPPPRRRAHRVIRRRSDTSGTIPSIVPGYPTASSRNRRGHLAFGPGRCSGSRRNRRLDCEGTVHRVCLRCRGANGSERPRESRGDERRSAAAGRHRHRRRRRALPSKASS